LLLRHRPIRITISSIRIAIRSVRITIIRPKPKTWPPHIDHLLSFINLPPRVPPSPTTTPPSSPAAPSPPTISPPRPCCVRVIAIGISIRINISPTSWTHSKWHLHYLLSWIFSFSSRDNHSRVAFYRDKGRELHKPTIQDPIQTILFPFPIPLHGQTILFL
jgi:hypothetical protein